MDILGTPIETIYLYTLITAGLLTLLYIFFGHISEAAAGLLHWLNPVLILSFTTFISAGGYVLEQITPLNSSLILAICAFSSFLLTILLNVFVFIPLSRAEESLVYTEESLNGRTGKVITSIPQDGFGEVVLESYSGMIAKSARSYDNLVIKEGTKVLVIDVDKGVLLVKEYEPLF